MTKGEGKIYLECQSPLHRLNPTTKIVSLLLLFILSFIFNHPFYLLFLLSLILLLGAGGKAFSNIKRGLELLIILFLLSAFSCALFLEGKELIWSGKFFSIYKDSLVYGLGIGIRLSIIIISAIIFVSCTRVEEFTWALNRLGLPFKMSFRLSLAFRWLHLFMKVIQTIVQAQRVRGLDLEGSGLIKRAIRYLFLIMPIINSVSRRTELLSQGLESKGFGLQEERSNYLYFRMQTIDYCLLALIFFLNLFALCLRLSGFGVVMSR